MAQLDPSQEIVSLSDVVQRWFVDNQTAMVKHHPTEYTKQNNLEPRTTRILDIVQDGVVVPHPKCEDMLYDDPNINTIVWSWGTFDFVVD